MPRYRDIATQLQQQIDDGSISTGDKLPSLRKMAAQLSVSVVTVQEAYKLLELRQIIFSRPQSGYYVASRQSLPPPPESKSLKPTQLKRGRDMTAIVDNSRHPQNFHFGLALVESSLQPSKALARATTAALRSQPAGQAALPPGSESLRQQISQRLLGQGCFISPEQLLISNGCQEALSLALQISTQPGDIVAVESPCYNGFLLALESLGLQALPIATDPQQGLDLEALATAVEQWPVVACLCSPNLSNPTGATMSDSRKQQLLQLAQQLQFTVIEDDIFGELFFQQPRPRPLLAMANEQQRERLITCSSFSKTIAPGLRVGWVIACGRQRQLIERQMATSTGVPGLMQQTLALYLESGHYERHLQRSRQCYQHNQQRLLQVVADHFPQGTRATCPSGGFIVWLALPRGVDSLQLYRDALAENISIMPGKLFARTGFKQYIRLSFARVWSKKAEQKLARVGELATIQLE